MLPPDRLVVAFVGSSSDVEGKAAVAAASCCPAPPAPNQPDAVGCACRWSLPSQSFSWGQASLLCSFHANLAAAPPSVSRTPACGAADDRALGAACGWDHVLLVVEAGSTGGHTARDLAGGALDPTGWPPRAESPRGGSCWARGSGLQGQLDGQVAAPACSPQAAGEECQADSGWDARGWVCSLPAYIRVVQVAAGELHSLALDASGSVWSWGCNSSGQLGAGACVGAGSGPCCVLGPGADKHMPDGGGAAPRIRQVCCGSRHSLAVDVRGGAWGWGWNAYGQVGSGDPMRGDVARPARLQAGALGGVPVRQLAAGLGHSLALTEAGQVAAWGWNDAGQCGLAPRQPEGGGAGRAALQPSWVALPRGAARSEAPRGCVGPGEGGDAGSSQDDEDDAEEVVQVSCGGRHSLALTAGGALLGWGSNSAGQLGLQGGGCRPEPQVLVPPPHEGRCGPAWPHPGAPHQVAVVGCCGACGAAAPGGAGAASLQQRPTWPPPAGQGLGSGQQWRVVDAAGGWSHTVVLLRAHEGGA